MEYKFYHSFPRRFCNGSSKLQMEKGLEILSSILNYGLLLVPEVVEFDGEIDIETGSATSELLALQRRFCLTHIGEEQLRLHAENFGGFHIEFDEMSIRELGAIPVFYIPKSEPSKGTGLDILGNTLLHRLSEIQDVLSILSEVDERLNERKKSLFGNSIKLYSNNSKRKFSESDLKWFLSSLKEGKQSFKELTATVELLSYIFYPTKRFSPSQNSFCKTDNIHKTSNMYYYLQREWRVIGGISLNSVMIDDDLTSHEKVSILDVDYDFFSKPVSDLFDSNRIIDECKIIREINGKKIRYFINKIYAPKSSREKLNEIQSKFGLNADIIYI